MAHSYLFFLHGLLIFGTWKFYRSPGWKYAAAIGLSAGLITLIRPVEFVCLAIPLFYGLGADRSLSEQWKFWRTHFRFISLAIGVFALCGLIQMLYWKVSSGQWIFYSYGEERFYFNKPKIGPGLFGFQNGWLPYSPVMVLSLFGLVYLFRHRRWLISVLIFLPLHVYFAYSWWCWYYINGVGSRPMVEATLAGLSLGLVSIPQPSSGGNASPGHHFYPVLYRAEHFPDLAAPSRDLMDRIRQRGLLLVRIRQDENG